MASSAQWEGPQIWTIVFSQPRRAAAQKAQGIKKTVERRQQQPAAVEMEDCDPNIYKFYAHVFWLYRIKYSN